MMKQSQIRILLLVLWTLSIAASEVLTAQHIYAPGHRGSGEKSGVIGYFSCKKRCHMLDKQRATIESSAWESLTGKDVWIEETAGWLVLWEDVNFMKPVLPTKDEIDQTFHEKEKGYLKDSLTIRLM
eukprot:TRINITY_DN34627_c0_g1_i1.p1 TRINITY_DN34627_c0_g1~~TRINITY_DN34627_c0_g1_i1.p1  ORF type:complete len:127 (+),score=15.83 TRINITY_DN34627_c0_g1_i1:41-421(+)